MPYRAYHLLLGLAGVAAILVLLVLRADPDHHVDQGPRWKRRLVSAGLLLLASMGLGPAVGCTEGKDPAKSGYSYPENDDRRRLRH